MAVLYTYVGEFQPANYREKALSFMEIPWVLGTVLAPGKCDSPSLLFIFQSWDSYKTIHWMQYSDEPSMKKWKISEYVFHLSGLCRDRIQKVEEKRNETVARFLKCQWSIKKNFFDHLIVAILINTLWTSLLLNLKLNFALTYISFLWKMQEIYKCYINAVLLLLLRYSFLFTCKSLPVRFYLHVDHIFSQLLPGSQYRSRWT